MSIPTRVLLVEDNPADADLVMEAFEREKISVVIDIVQDGQAALDYLYELEPEASSQRPDIILLDLNLPRKSGQEVLAEIKADASLKTIPVVILSTSALEEDILGTYNLHANGYVTKPGNLREYSKVAHGIDDFWFNIARLPRSPSWRTYTDQDQKNN